VVGGSEEVLDGSFGFSRFSPVVAHDGGHVSEAVPEGFLGETCDDLVPISPGRARQGGVGDLTSEHVFESQFDVTLDARLTLPADQASALERIEGVVEMVIATQPG